MASTKKRDASEAELDADGNGDNITKFFESLKDFAEQESVKSMTPFRVRTYRKIQEIVCNEDITKLKLCESNHFFHSIFDCVVYDRGIEDYSEDYRFSNGVSIGNYYLDDWFDLPLKSAVRKKNMEIVKYITESIPIPTFDDIDEDCFEVLNGKLLRCAACALANDYIEGYNYLQEFVSTRKNQLKELIKSQTDTYDFKSCFECSQYISENTSVYPECDVFDIFDNIDCVKVFEKIEKIKKSGCEDDDSVETSDTNDDDSVSSIEEMGCLVSNNWILRDGEEEYQTFIEDLSYIIKYGVPPDTVCPTYGYDVKENVLELKSLVLQMKNDLSDFEKIATLKNVPKSGVSRYIFLVKCGLLRSRENWEKQNEETNDWNHDDYTGCNHYNFSRSYMPYLVFYRHILYLQMSDEDKIKEKDKWQELLGHVYIQGKLTTNDLIVCFDKIVPEYRKEDDMSSFYEDAVFSSKEIQDVANHYKVDLSFQEVKNREIVDLEEEDTDQETIKIAMDVIDKGNIINEFPCSHFKVLSGIHPSSVKKEDILSSKENCSYFTYALLKGDVFAVADSLLTILLLKFWDAENFPDSELSSRKAFTSTEYDFYKTFKVSADVSKDATLTELLNKVMNYRLRLILEDKNEDLYNEFKREGVSFNAFPESLYSDLEKLRNPVDSDDDSNNVLDMEGRRKLLLPWYATELYEDLKTRGFKTRKDDDIYKFGLSSEALSKIDDVNVSFAIATWKIFTNDDVETKPIQQQIMNDLDTYYDNLGRKTEYTDRLDKDKITPQREQMKRMLSLHQFLDTNYDFENDEIIDEGNILESGYDPVAIDRLNALKQYLKYELKEDSEFQLTEFYYWLNYKYKMGSFIEKKDNTYTYKEGTCLDSDGSYTPLNTAPMEFDFSSFDDFTREIAIDKNISENAIAELDEVKEAVTDKAKLLDCIKSELTEEEYLNWIDSVKDDEDES